MVLIIIIIIAGALAIAGVLIMNTAYRYDPRYKQLDALNHQTENMAYRRPVNLVFKLDNADQFNGFSLNDPKVYKQVTTEFTSKLDAIDKGGNNLNSINALYDNILKDTPEIYDKFGQLKHTILDMVNKQLAAHMSRPEAIPFATIEYSYTDSSDKHKSIHDTLESVWQA